MKLADLEVGRIYRVGGSIRWGLWQWKGEIATQTQGGYSGRKVKVARMHKVIVEDPSEPLVAAYKERGLPVLYRGDIEAESRKIPSTEIQEEFASTITEALAKLNAENQASAERRAAVDKILDDLEEVTGLVWRRSLSSFSVSLAEDQAKLFIERQRALQS